MIATVLLALVFKYQLGGGAARSVTPLLLLQLSSSSSVHFLFFLGCLFLPIGRRFLAVRPSDVSVKAPPESQKSKLQIYLAFSFSLY